jgi:hypothetical protein
MRRHPTNAHTARTSEADRRSPKGERGRQIAAVRSLVREARAAGKRMAILRACRKAWQNVKGGYPSVKTVVRDSWLVVRAANNPTGWHPVALMEKLSTGRRPRARAWYVIRV